MSSYTATLRKRALKAAGFYRQTHRIVGHHDDGQPILKKIEGLGPIRRPDNSIAGMTWSQAR